MIFIVFLLLLAIATAAPAVAPVALSAASNQTCNAKVFDKPWSLTDIRIYKPGKDAISDIGQIGFHLCDTNERLSMTTTCTGILVDDKAEGNGGAYLLCDNNMSAFKYIEGLLMVNRWFQDDCLGDYPYNSGFAYGQNNVNTFEINVKDAGTLHVQEYMSVVITAMS